MAIPPLTSFPTFLSLHCSPLLLQFHSVQELERLGQMISVTTLVLEGNLFTQTGMDIMSLANTLRKIFPNIQTVVRQIARFPIT